MINYQKNPLEAFGQYTWADYAVFKAHLRLPKEYLRILFRNYNNLRDVVIHLPTLVDKYADHLWEKRKMDAEIKERFYRSCHIPPQFHKTTVYITANSKDQSDLAATIKHVDKLVGTGISFYFHSAFSEGAMHAASDILRAAIDRCIKSYCALYPSVLDIVKKWDLEDSTLDRLRVADILVLWGVGSEYATEFTNTQLSKIMLERRADKKVTILVSSLNPKEFKTRYGQDPEGIVVEFKDTKLKQTLAEVREMLEGNA